MINIPSSSFDGFEIQNLSLGSSVQIIGSSSFLNNQITSLTLPGSLLSIGDWAFQDNQLQTLTIPNSVTSLGKYAFSKNLLTDVEISTGLSIIAEGTFWSNQLESANIPNSVTEIGAYAFNNNMLASLTLPDSLQIIHDWAFWENNLTTLAIPESVFSIGAGAFSDNNLLDLYIEGNPTLGNRAFAHNGIDRHSIPSELDLIGDYEYRQNNAQLLQIYADNPDFVASHQPGGLYLLSVSGTTYATSGFIVNPGSINVSYQDTSGNSLATDLKFVGRTSLGIPMTDFLIMNNLDLATDPSNPSINFSEYYKAGDTITIDPLDFPGYQIMSSLTFNLTSGPNEAILTYKSLQGIEESSSAEDKLHKELLAATGNNSEFILGLLRAVSLIACLTLVYFIRKP